MDEEYIVCALFHDVGYTISTYSHAGLAANMLRPFVSPQHHWMLAHHDVFEGYFFQHHLGRATGTPAKNTADILASK